MKFNKTEEKLLESLALKMRTLANWEVNQRRMGSSLIPFTGWAVVPTLHAFTKREQAAAQKLVDKGYLQRADWFGIAETYIPTDRYHRDFGSDAYKAAQRRLTELKKEQQGVAQ